jgi:AraC-like DNA-binding protein
MGNIRLLNNTEMCRCKRSTHSFGLFSISRSSMGHPWHCHEEFEIIFFKKSQGTLYVGDKILRYRPGLMIFLGPRVPHAFFHRSRKGEENDTEIQILFFHRDFLGKEFFSAPELSSIRQFLDSVVGGYRVDAHTRDLVATKMAELGEKEGPDRLILLLRILDTLANAPRMPPLTSPGYCALIDERRSRRLDAVLGHVQTAFRDEVSLKRVAALASMSPQGLCRFLRQKTGLSLSGIVNQVRVNRVCEELIAGDAPIGDIAFESGFQNLANFNRRFRSITGVSPREYRQQTKPRQRSRVLIYSHT